jgi:succinate-semialdehyde dehydrogenase/glutarate-semialdehyde dehydrogenase
VPDPSTGTLIGTCAECDGEDTKLAIKAAADAFPAFRSLTGRERAKMLRKWYDLMVENADDIAKLITWENGKPVAEAKGEAVYAANFFEWFSEEAPRTYGDTIPATVPGNRVWTMKEPVGVCGLITPCVRTSRPFAWLFLLLLLLSLYKWTLTACLLNT